MKQTISTIASQLDLSYRDCLRLLLDAGFQPIENRVEITPEQIEQFRRASVSLKK